MRTGRGRRLSDKERETTQALMRALNISQLARAMRCSRSTVRYWQAEKRDENGERQFVRPKGMFADGR